MSGVFAHRGSRDHREPSHGGAGGADGTIDWLCLPAFDSPSVFCSILDDEKGGHFALRPVEYTRSQQIYLPDTNVLLTRFFSPEGLAEITGLHAYRDGSRASGTGWCATCGSYRGRMDFRVECRPAFDYARQDHSVSVGKSRGRLRVGRGLPRARHATCAEEGEEGPRGRGFTLGEGERARSFWRTSTRARDRGRYSLSVGFEDFLHRTLRTGGAGSPTAPITGGGGRWFTAPRSS